MNALVHSDVASRRWLVFVSVALLLPGIGLDQPTASLGISKSRSATMNTFVIIFRQGRVVTDTDRQRSGEETAVWAGQQTVARHKLDPRILAPESVHRGPDRDLSEPGDVRPITALLFLKATDLDEAVQIAERHPALRYGANVEVRRWAPPVSVPTKPTPVR